MSLLQQIRAEQAMHEAGIKGEPVCFHQEDVKTIISGVEYKLVFPKFLLEYNCSNKDIDVLFVGLITEKRRKFLENFPSAKIIESFNGRNDILKNRDESYFELMSRAKFVLCPDGDFTWTYRFFESVIFQAIPVIENFSPLYEGYHFYRKGEEFHYDVEVTKKNLDKMKKEMFLVDKTESF